MKTKTVLQKVLKVILCTGEKSSHNSETMGKKINLIRRIYEQIRIKNSSNTGKNNEKAGIGTYLSITMLNINFPNSK